MTQDCSETAFGERAFEQGFMCAEVVNKGDCEEGVAMRKSGPRSQLYTSHAMAANCKLWETGPPVLELRCLGPLIAFARLTVPLRR